MEFLPVTRFRKVLSPVIPPYAELKAMRPLMVSMDLVPLPDQENQTLLDEAAAAGVGLIPVRKVASGGFGDRSDFPGRVLFEMTSICNTRCLMCPQMNLKRKAMHMDMAKYMSVLDEIDAHGVEGLWIYHFGESMTHPRFEDLLAYLGTKKNLGHIWLSTNGILCNERRARLLLDSCLSYLNFSLQALAENTYAAIAPSSPARRILDNLEGLLRMKQGRLGMKPFLRLQIIDQPLTRDEIDPFLRAYHDRCDMISVNALEHTDIGFNQKGIDLRARGERRACTRLSRPDCFVNSDGSVALCDNAYNNEMDVGNVWEQSLHDIWNGPKRREYREKCAQGLLWDREPCAGCTDYDL